MIIQYHRFMLQFANKQTLLFDFFFKGEGACELFLRSLKFGLSGGGGLFSCLELFSERFELRLGVFDEFA